MKMIWVKQGLRMYSIKFYWNQWCRDGLPWSYNQDFKPCKLEEEKVETYFCGAFLENLVLIQNLYNLQTRIICSTRPWPGHPVEGKTSKAKVSYTNAYLFKTVHVKVVVESIFRFFVHVSRLKKVPDPVDICIVR